MPLSKPICIILLYLKEIFCRLGTFSGCMLDGRGGDEDGQLMESGKRFTRAGLLDEVAVELPGEVEPVHGEVEAVVAVAVVLPPHVFHLDQKPLVDLTRTDFLSHYSNFSCNQGRNRMTIEGACTYCQGCLIL